MEEFGVYITLKNTERTIEACIMNVIRAFDFNFTVLDVGSTDSGPSRVRKMEVSLQELGDLNPVDYTAMRKEESSKYKRVLWIDADEIWPVTSLLYARKLVSHYDKVTGFWRNVDIRDGKTYASSLTFRGSVAWNTEKFWPIRAWPRERLLHNDLEPHTTISPPPDSLWCWHAVLLDLSSQPTDGPRKEKRDQRREQFKDLDWTLIKDLPFQYNEL